MKNLSVNSRGVTLIELIIAIVVVSVALTGVLLVINYTTTHSVDALLQHQAVAIAEAYFEEISLKDFADPDTGIVCGSAEASRTLYDNVCDYNNLSQTGARDQFDQPITGLEGYAIAVSIAPQALSGISAADALRVVVTVTDPVGSSLTLTGYRTRY